MRRSRGRLQGLLLCSVLAGLAPAVLGACEGPRVKLPVREADDDVDAGGDAVDAGGDDVDAGEDREAGAAGDADAAADIGDAGDLGDAGDAAGPDDAADARDAADAGRQDDDDIVPCSATQPCTHSILTLCGRAGLCVECLSNADCKQGVCDLLEGDCE